MTPDLYERKLRFSETRSAEEIVVGRKRVRAGYVTWPTTAAPLQRGGRAGAGRAGSTRHSNYLSNTAEMKRTGKEEETEEEAE